MMLWDPYVTVQTEMRQMQGREIALVGTKHSGKLSGIYYQHHKSLSSIHILSVS